MALCCFHGCGGAVQLFAMPPYKLLPKKQSRKRVAIYGAGLAGQQIAAALNRSDDYLPVCFIDDKGSLRGQSLSGLKIYSPKKALSQIG